MPDFLRIEDAECILPEKMQGDLLIYPDELVFVTYQRSPTNTLKIMFGGLFGFLWRASKMNDWRDRMRGKTIDEMIALAPGSWRLCLADVQRAEKKFPAYLVLHIVNGQVYRLSVPRWQDFKYFAEKRKMPIATAI